MAAMLMVGALAPMSVAMATGEPEAPVLVPAETGAPAPAGDGAAPADDGAAATTATTTDEDAARTTTATASATKDGTGRFPGQAAPTLTVTIRTETGGRSVPASGWALTASASTGASAAPGQATTAADGTATFTLGHDPAASSQQVTITQTQQAGYAIKGPAHATCTAGGASLAVTSTDGGFAVDVPAGTTVNCTITNRAVASTYVPGPAETKVVLRAGGDRLVDGSVTGVAGASFDVYRAHSAGALDGGTRVGTCTTTADGTCAVVVSLASATQEATFYGVQTATSVGWTLAERWGGTADLVRYSTRVATGGGTASLPSSSRRWPQVRANPEFPMQCGLNIALVYDLSNSVTRGEYANEFGTYKAAGTGVVDALEGTPSQLGLYTYAEWAPAGGEANKGLDLMSVARREGADTVRKTIADLTGTPDEEQGWTNWDRGLAQLPTGLDVVVFLTDGAPSDSRSTLRGGLPTLLMVEEAIHSANAVKANGAHLVAIGAGPAHDDANHQRLTLLSEDTRLSGFAELGAMLKEVALKGCVGTVNVVNDVRAIPGAPLTPGAGWEFTPDAAGAGTVPGPARTDADGTASFAIDLSAHTPPTRAVTLVQTPRAGYAIEPQHGFNAECTASDKAPVEVRNVEHGFVVEARHDAVITCRVVNAAVPNPAVAIVKTSAVDRAGEVPTVVDGTDITWSYTVTNTGNVPLTTLRVTDDGDVAVTCPPTAGSPATGNPIAVLAIGESLTCSATGPVTPRPSPAPGTANERTVA